MPDMRSFTQLVPKNYEYCYEDPKMGQIRVTGDMTCLCVINYVT